MGRGLAFEIFVGFMGFEADMRIGRGLGVGAMGFDYMITRVRARLFELGVSDPIFLPAAW